MRLAVTVFLFACSHNSPPAQTPSQDSRTAAVAQGSEHYALFEGTSFKNQCAADGDCKVGGCSGEVCTSEEGVNTACMAYPDQPKGATCGCVGGDCIWYQGGATPVAGGGEGAAQGEPCSDGKCAAGLTCVKYYGIAGPRGPQFTSCEIPCSDPASKCPEGQTCVTIADGPGRVCRKKG